MTVVALLSSRRAGLGVCDREALRAALSAAADLELSAVAIAATDRGAGEPALRVALRAGCDRAIAVEADPASLDVAPIARALADAVREVEAQLIVCGDQSEAHRRGAVGPAVAEILGIPHLSGVLGVDVAGAELRCRAHLDGQSIWFAAALPILLCVRAAGRPAPRRGATTATIEVVGDATEPGELGGRELSVNPRGGAAITESPADLVRRLRDDHLIR